ncbi:MAG: methionyl-tRNA formyltransferase [Actinomycetota bacterium]
MRADIEIVGVVTNPDRPAGRGLDPRPPPVKVAAHGASLDVIQPKKARDPALEAWLRGRDPDVATVVAYGKILPRPLLEVPRLGFVNVHFSLLPQYRGATPVQRAIIDGLDRTGVSIMLLTEGMDEGPILATAELAIEEEETAGELGERLAELGAALLVEALEGYESGAMVPREQDHDRASYAPKVSPDEARVEWARSAREIKDLVRGLNPAPGAWTTIRGKRVNLHRVRAASGPALDPGEIDPSGERAGTGRGVVELLEVQLEGRRVMSGAELGRGLRVTPGERFE